ncbi:MAG: phytanoyl-CoA dioxygenase family protein [Rhodoferax sp.]|nr:phytanoyl-CoA dioxygenase family protein [Rhodoferax sp.]
MSALPATRRTPDHVAQYWDQGYAIVRGVFSAAEMREAQAESRRIYDLGLQHHATWRHQNVLFEILPEAYAGRRYVLQAHWYAWFSPLFEAMRRDPRVLAVMEPLLGRDIRQVAQQIHWKPPGATRSSGYRFHQDLRFRERQDAYRDLMQSYINTGLAIDPATSENGCLQVFPGSHRKGYLGLADDGPIMKGSTQNDELKAAGLDPAQVVQIELEPGDLALWGLLTVHGSQVNRSARDRAFAIQSYVRADTTDRGEWAFRDGVSVPLGAQPHICKYEALHERPGPFYDETRWWE